MRALRLRKKMIINTQKLIRVLLHQTYRNRHPWKRKYNEDSGHLNTVEESHDFCMYGKMRKPLSQNLEELKPSFNIKESEWKHPQRASAGCAILVSPLLSLERGSGGVETGLPSLGSEIIFLPSLLSLERVPDSGDGGKWREEPRLPYEPNDGKMLAPRFSGTKKE